MRSADSRRVFAVCFLFCSVSIATLRCGPPIRGSVFFCLRLISVRFQSQLCDAVRRFVGTEQMLQVQQRFNRNSAMRSADSSLHLLQTIFSNKTRAKFQSQLCDAVRRFIPRTQIRSSYCLTFQSQLCDAVRRFFVLIPALIVTILAFQSQLCDAVRRFLVLRDIVPLSEDVSIATLRCGPPIHNGSSRMRKILRSTTSSFNRNSAMRSADSRRG